VLVLDTHDTTTPLSGKVGIIVVLNLEHSAEVLEIDVVFTADFGEGKSSGSLEVDKLTEIGLSANEAEGNTLLSAESGQVNDELNWVDVVSDDDHLGFVLFDEGGDVVETKLDVHGLVSLLFVSSFGLSLQSEGLFLVSLRLILSKQFKKLGSLVLLESIGELVDGGGHLQSLHQDSLLSLDSNVARPFDETGEVTFGLDISTKSEILSRFLEEGAGASGTSRASLRLNDLLSLSFLHHND